MVMVGGALSTTNGYFVVPKLPRVPHGVSRMTRGPSATAVVSMLATTWDVELPLPTGRVVQVVPVVYCTIKLATPETSEASAVTLRAPATSCCPEYRTGACPVWPPLVNEAASATAGGRVS